MPYVKTGKYVLVVTLATGETYTEVRVTEVTKAFARKSFRDVLQTQNEQGPTVDYRVVLEPSDGRMFFFNANEVVSMAIHPMTRYVEHEEAITTDQVDFEQSTQDEIVGLDYEPSEGVLESHLTDNPL